MSRDEGYLCDMLVAAREALDFARGHTRESFRTDRVLQNAIVHVLQIIGEAARRVSLDFRDLHGEIPWTDIIGCVTASYTSTSASTPKSCGAS
jgi:uncharacterized protein with HEPN domain